MGDASFFVQADYDGAPVLKIGAVVLDEEASGQRSETRDAAHAPNPEPRMLILRPHPKQAGEVPPLVLPRGSRQYATIAADGATQWHDARDEATGRAHAATLEPFARGLARELAEEAGIDAALLARSPCRALGALPFHSRHKGIYPIYWFVVTLAAADAAALLATPLPMDASERRWETLAAIEALAARGEFSAGYLPVIHAALRSQ